MGRLMTTAAKLKIADRNFKAFSDYASRKYPPASVLDSVCISYAGGVITVSHVWTRMGSGTSKVVAVLPHYEMFDPEFDPEKFYAQ